MTSRQSLLLLAAVSMSAALVACGGSSTMSTTPASPIGSGSDLPLSGSFTASSNGVLTGTLADLDTSSTPAVHHFAYYLVDTSRAVLIETDNAQLTLGFLELQSH